MNILSIDQGACAGWALWINSKPTKWGEAKGTSQCADVIDIATALTRSPEHDPDILRCLVVFEDHSSMRMMGQKKRGQKRTFNTQASTLLGMGRAHGWWEVLLDQAGHDPRARIKVDPRTWKGKVLGMANADRETSLAAAVRHAEALGALMPGPDEAVATVMAHWASKAPEALEAWERAYGLKARKRKGAA